MQEQGWANVRLVESSVEDAGLEPGSFDAALLSFTHDVLQSDAAVDAVVGAVRRDGKIATTGVKWGPRWAVPVNAAVWVGARRYVTTFDGFDRPWARLGDHLVDMWGEFRLLGTMYVFSGRVPT